MLITSVPVHDLPSRKKGKRLSVVCKVFCSFLRKDSDQLDSKYDTWLFLINPGLLEEMRKSEHRWINENCRSSAMRTAVDNIRYNCQ